MDAHAAPPLADLAVLVVDCQATAAASTGHLLELAWMRTCARRLATSGEVQPDPARELRTRLIGLPAGVRIPPAVVRITGITPDLLHGADDAETAWQALADTVAASAPHPAPAVIHYASFEQPFLVALHTRATTPDLFTPATTVARNVGHTGFPLDIVCTHAIAKRLLPDLPRRSLRALAGYLGRAVGPLRRAGDHVEATAFVWRELVALLAERGVETWPALREWLQQPVTKTAPLVPLGRRPPRRVWPMPRDVRLALPEAPGIYRMLRINGDILYVGKATALHHRVNSYFRKQQHIPERLLEMLSQARALSYEVTPTALEAALVEADEIKRHRPPYNIALTVDRRDVWFATPGLTAWSSCLSPECALGPLVSADTLQRFNALAQGDRAALPAGRWGPDPRTFADGYARFRAGHRELASARPMPGPLAGAQGEHDPLLRLGTRLWREGRRDHDEPDGDPDTGSDGNAADGTVGEQAATVNERGRPAWTPELVQLSLEWLVIRAALERRRALWLTRLVDATLQWCEPDSSTSRLLIVEQGDIVHRETVGAGTVTPVPPGVLRPTASRRAVFGLACFDRLRVLTTEMKRLVAAGAPVSLRLGPGPALTGDRLAAALWWV